MCSFEAVGRAISDARHGAALRLGRHPGASAAKHGFPSPIFLQRHGEYWQALLGPTASACHISAAASV